MTFHNLKTGSERVAGLVRGYARFLIIAAVFGLAYADEAVAQRSLASVMLPTDTSGTRKASKPARATEHRFLRNQLEHTRVFDARFEKRFELKKLFRERGLAYPAAEIFLRVFKRERQLELWVRPEAQNDFVLLKSYEICALGDKPGPKRVQGDRQTPEGFYYIDDFNPRSGYHLSLHVNYPNASDRILGGMDKIKGNLGGDIFVHGDCKTAGCVAVTDENIKEIYTLAIEARDNGQTRIPVHIFPARLTDDAFAQYARVFKDQQSLVDFWSNLKTGYDYFETKRKLPEIDVNKRGRYVFKTSESTPSL